MTDIEDNLNIFKYSLNYNNNQITNIQNENKKNNQLINSFVNKHEKIKNKIVNLVLEIKEKK